MLVLQKYLQNLGFETYMDNAGEKIASNANNLYGFLKGNDLEPILLSAHMDTVTPGNGIEAVIEGDLISSKGETILGADDKSGIAIILEAIETIIENNLEHRPIEIAFTIYEEGGLHGSKQLEMEKFSAKHALVFDSGGEIGTIVTTAPGQNKLEIKIEGKPAHAGLEPENGVNAFEVAAKAMNELKMGRIDFETTSNIGVVSGGVATNIVMPSLEIVAEVRSLNNDKLTSESNKIKEIFESTAQAFNAKAKIEIETMYNSFDIAKDHPFVQEVSKSFTNIGLNPIYVSTGGGSDTNIFTAAGLIGLNISTGMNAVHTTKENIKISDMEKCCEFLIDYLTSK